MELITQQNDTLHKICMRAYGDTTMLTHVLAANRHLADHGVILPIGLKINLPAKIEKPPYRDQIKLWD